MTSGVEQCCLGTAAIVFNLRRLQANANVQTNVLDEFLYADGMDKNASSEANSKGQ